VETCANVPWIILNGGEAFASMGVGKSRGTKVFALAGKVKRMGFIEFELDRTRQGLILLEEHANSVGVYDIGVEPRYLPGRISLDNEESRKKFEEEWDMRLPTVSEIRTEGIHNLFISGNVNGVLVIGEVPLDSPPEAKHFRGLEFMALWIFL